MIFTRLDPIVYSGSIFILTFKSKNFLSYYNTEKLLLQKTFELNIFYLDHQFLVVINY